MKHLFLNTKLSLLTLFSVLVCVGCSFGQPDFPTEDPTANEQASNETRTFEESTMLLTRGSEDEDCGSPEDEGSSKALGQCASSAEPAPVPDVVGMKAEAACRKLLRGGWMAYIWGKRDVSGSSVKPGRIVAQKPRACTVLQPQGTFLFVAKPFPDVLPKNTHCASGKVGPID